MFIRPVGVSVSAAVRPAGRPLLRGLLARAAGGGSLPEEPGPPPVAPAAGPGPVPAPAPAPALPGGMEPGALADALTRLADLAREGLLTPAEFASAKSRLLPP